MKTLFDVVVEGQEPHVGFRRLREEAVSEPARWMLDDVYQTFADPEGNFLEQFQTAAFDARLFELYLFAYLSRSGFEVDRNQVTPDFLVSRGGGTVAVEATTVNPSTSGILGKIGKKISDLSHEELIDYRQNELPIRFGSPLVSKLRKKYWELPQCRDIPFVIAIEAFHDEESLALSDSALSRYLFGLEQTASWAQEGRLAIKTTEVQGHRVGDKQIPSGFFQQPDAEHVSAVMFTNSGTYAKFARMGYQHGIGCDVIHMERVGYSFNPDPNAMDASFFSYSLDNPPFVEPWGQGLVVLLNPDCLHPIPRDFFPYAVQGYLKNGAFLVDCPPWHPFSSKTLVMHLGKAKRRIEEALPYNVRSTAVVAITREQFRKAIGFPPAPVGEEEGWFTDETGSFLGVVVRDRVDKDWGYVTLARDPYFRFRAIGVEFSFSTREEAVRELQLKIADLLSSPQRIFPQE